MEKTLETKRIYDGKILNVRKDKVLLDNNNTSYREIVEHNGGSAIALKNQENKYYMVKQYRYAQKCDVLEFIAGKLEKDEDPYDAIVREVVEESGYSAKNIQSFGYIIPTGGYSEEKIYLYYGEVDQHLGQNLDEDENLELFTYSLDEIETMIKNGQIQDGKTIALVYHLKNMSK